MNQKDSANAERTARDYYNSRDADEFYFRVWGGEDIHVGLYNEASEAIPVASRRTVEKLASLPRNLSSGSKVLDIGSGYGGAARILASTTGCYVTCLNLSEVENDRNRQLTQKQGLDDKITIIDGSFEDLPFQDGQFDIVWSQDAILHSGDRGKVVREVARVLKPRGEFVMTDPMQSDHCPEGVLQPILDRIHLSNLGSPEFYKRAGEEAGLSLLGFVDHTEQLALHYQRVLDETRNQESLLKGHVDPDYLERMKRGLEHWVQGGKNGWLAWGYFHFVKS